MYRKMTLIGCLAAALLTGLGMNLPQQRTTPAVTQASAPIRIGVFDSRGVALAYGRSARPDCMTAKVDQIRREHDDASKAGDKDRMKQLETQAIATQDRIHKQVFSGAPIPEVLALLKDDLPEVAKEANVSMIIGDVLYHGDDVELVDVTLEMCEPFKPDAKTRQMIKDLIAKPPVPESQLSPKH